MALDKIIVGCDWVGTLTVTPTSGETASDVTTHLTGASVAANLEDIDGTVIATAAGAVVSAANRTVSLTLTDTITSGLTPGDYRWDARLTTSGGMIYPIAIGERGKVRARAE
jgi:hypothetical protein